MLARIREQDVRFRRMLAAAAKEPKIAQAVRATGVVIQDLFETAVNTAYGTVATAQQIREEWENFMLQRSAEKGP